MKITDQVADTAILHELGERLASIRLARNLKQADLAMQAGISKRTLERMEAGGATQLANLVRVCRALGLVDGFETLVPQPLPSPLAQLKLRGRQRQRAASTRSAAPVNAVNEPAGKWTWGDTPGDQAEDKSVHKKGDKA